MTRLTILVTLVIACFCSCLGLAIAQESRIGNRAQTNLPRQTASPAGKAQGVQADAPKVASNEILQEFALRDFLNHEWRHEVVTYEAKGPLYGRKDVVIAGPDGKARPLQWFEDGGQKKIAFHADVPTYGKSVYRLVKGAPYLGTDLKVEETADGIRLSNTHVGILIRKVLKEGEAPIGGIRLPSGAWIGNSQRLKTPNLEAYGAKVVAQGPVFAEAICEARFGKDRVWRMRFRLEAEEPVVKVDETSTLGEGPAWHLRLDEKFAPTHLFYRMGAHLGSTLGLLSTSQLKDVGKNVFNWQPWLQWWSTERQGTWFSLYNDQQPDLLALAARDAAVWVDPNAGKPQAAPCMPVIQENGELRAEFSLTGGERRWMICALDKGPSLKLLEAKGEDLKCAPPPQQYLIKHGNFPLDRVKDYVLEWKGDDQDHPRLLVTQEDLVRIRKVFKPNPSEKSRVMGLQPAHIMGGLYYYLATGEKEIGRRLAERAMQMMEGNVGSFLIQGGPLVSYGSTPHLLHSIMEVTHVSDVVWSSALTPEERERMKAQAAFVAYAVTNPSFWSPARGYAANPNMTSMVASFQAATGALIASHPMAKQWMSQGMEELHRQLMEWSDEKGGWLEAPHYAMVSFDYLLSLFLMAANGGEEKFALPPRLREVALYFAKISTPPDPKMGGMRHLPAIGNTYPNEPTGEFGIVAALWRKKDPQFAAEMQWMHQQQGCWRDAGIGGAFPAFGAFRGVLIDPDLPAKKPAFTSTVFPRTGVSLRNGVEDRETQLYMIAGRNSDHYDADQGSITIWGKGRVIANDFGYSELKNEPDHSLVESPARQYHMTAQNFTPGPAFDYVRGVAGEWHRQIAFVKDSDMMAPNYFVIRDSIRTQAAGTWHLWLEGKVQVNAQGGMTQALFEGTDDVDADIVFAQPPGVSMETREATSKSWGVGANRTYDRFSRTMIGLTAAMPPGKDVLVVIYPRLKKDKPPTVTALADGRGVKIQHEAGTDYVFLNDERFVSKEDGILFEGVSGLVKIRGDKATLALGEGGRLSRGKDAITAELPAAGSKVAKR